MEQFSIVLIAFTAFWGLVGIVVPWVIPKGPNQRYKLINLLNEKNFFF